MISSVNFNQLIKYTGAKKTAKDIHVFRNREFHLAPPVHQPLRIDYFIIVLSLGGVAHVRLDLTDYYLEKNGLLIIPPSTIHEIVQGKNNSFIAIGFIPAFFWRVALNKNIEDSFTYFASAKKPYFSLSTEEANVLFDIMMALYEKEAYDIKHPFKQELIEHTFCIFMYEFAAISKKYCGSTNFKVNRRENILISFLKELPLHFKVQRSVRFYAALLFITPKHLNKTIKELTNKTCGELIDDRVITEAKALLKNSCNSVANVADHLHFCNQFCFSKFFKKNTGQSPSAYRNGGL